MNIETNRSNRIAFVVGVVVVPFAVGLAMALWGKPDGQIVTRVVGAVLILTGLFLLTSRNLFKRDAVVPAALQIPAEHMIRMRMRILGATVLLAGVSQFASDIRVQTAFMPCAGAVSMAGFFKVPRRLFMPEKRAE